MRVSTDAAPLAGLRVLEISSFVAAPLGGLTLAAVLGKTQQLTGEPQVSRSWARSVTSMKSQGLA
jgi:2-methylfumaryl-CoA isomerase